MKFLALVFWLALCFWVGTLLGTAHAESLLASYYGSESGHRTASGEPFRPSGLTAAHRSWAFGTVLRVCFRGCVVVRINDRGPYSGRRGLDLSHGAAERIGLVGPGVARVSVERL